MSRSAFSSKVLGGIAGAIAGMVAYLAVSNAIKGPIGGSSVEAQIEKLAADLNKRLPMQVDPVTKWERVEAGPGKAYSYIYTVSQNLSDLEKQAVRNSTTRQALAAPEMRPIFAAGVTVWYKYYDSSGQKMLEFPVKK